MSPKRIIAVLTSHNRASATMGCLRRLHAGAEHAGVYVSAVLVDDGSTDGTAERVTQEFPWVQVLSTDGTLFWNRGMHRAMRAAMAQPHDFVLWLNDDTDLEADALQRLLDASGEAAAKSGRPVIVVGATADRTSGKLTYGGIVAPHRWRPFKYEKIHSERDALQCHTMNGNVVLLPAEIVRDVGNLDPAFEHAMGDIDYGLRARARGHPIFVASGFVGRCSNNPVAGTFKDSSLPLRRRLDLFVSRKGLPPRSWLHFTRAHGGVLWPLYFCVPYVSFFVAAFWETRRGRAKASLRGH
jgi:GT2 family glycosyltransferase